VECRGRGKRGGKHKHVEERQTLSGKWPADVDAALEILLTQQGVDQSKIAVGGASCGVPQAANMVIRQHRIHVLLLFSGPVTDDAKKYISQTPDVAVFGGASEQDAGQGEGITE